MADDSEADYRRWTEPASEELTELGVPHFFVKREGTHVGEIYDTYSRLMLDRINAAFAAPDSPPKVFSYKTIDTSFTIWGYDVVVDRPNTEFVSLLGARADGSSFVLAGAGTARVTTPAAFEPEARYAVTVTRESGAVAHEQATADRAGRLSVSVDLGPARTTDETRAALAAGTFRLYQTEISVQALAAD